jgi:S1-C subfamily serine protease
MRMGRTVPSAVFACLAFVLLAGGLPDPVDAQSAPTIDRVKASIVAIGTHQATRAPPFRFLGTGFIVGDGTVVVTSAHVVPAAFAAGDDPEGLVAAPPGARTSRASVRRLTAIAVDREHDLALLKIDGSPMRPLKVRDSAAVGEGDQFLFSGFPVGAALGLIPVTHRAMIAAVAPVALPSATDQQLDARAIRKLRESAFPIFQLDATAYPGSSGSPLYEAATGEVVGVVNMGLVKATRESALTQPTGITYAVPSRYLIDLLARVKP